MAHRLGPLGRMDGSFGAALKLMNGGRKVRRRGWKENMWIAIQLPGHKSIMTLPFIYINVVQDKVVPWTATHLDLLSNDWEMIA